MIAPLFEKTRDWVRVAWIRDGSIPQGCPLSMVFIVALFSPWCRYLESLAGISPQLYADNLKCTSYNVDSVLAAAQKTLSYVHAVGQEASPSKCVLLSTSKAALRRMTAWRNMRCSGFRWSFGRHLTCCSWYFE